MDQPANCITHYIARRALVFPPFPHQVIEKAYHSQALNDQCTSDADVGCNHL